MFRNLCYIFLANETFNWISKMSRKLLVAFMLFFACSQASGWLRLQLVQFRCVQLLFGGCFCNKLFRCHRSKRHSFRGKNKCWRYTAPRWIDIMDRRNFISNFFNLLKFRNCKYCLESNSTYWLEELRIKFKKLANFPIPQSNSSVAERSI